jgi:hypothetical protein
MEVKKAVAARELSKNGEVDKVPFQNMTAVLKRWKSRLIGPFIPC